MRKVGVTIVAVIGVAALAAWLLFPLTRHAHLPQDPCKWDPAIDPTMDCSKKCGASYTGLNPVQAKEHGVLYYFCCHKGYELRGNDTTGYTCKWNP